jgi:hypothetical protein
MVRICILPLSPIAFRGRSCGAEPDAQIQPPQTNAIRSALMTSWPRFFEKVYQQFQYLWLHRHQFAVKASLAKSGIEMGKLKLSSTHLIASLLKKKSSSSHEDISPHPPIARRRALNARVLLPRTWRPI